jgi:hypothetical protein
MPRDGDLVVSDPTSTTRRSTAVATVVALLTTLVMVVPMAPAARADAHLDHDRFLEAAYEGLLGRSPDAAGLRYWHDRLAGGVAPRTVLESFGLSGEHHRHVVTSAYQRFLRRAPDSEGLAWWSTRLGDTRAAVSLWAGLAGSVEYLATRGGGTDDGFVRALYDDVLGREPDAGGLAHWVARLDAGATRTSVARSVVGSPEAFGLSDLPVRSTSPDRGSTVARVDTVELHLGRDLLVDASTVLVSVDGRRLRGTIEADGSTLRFVATETPTWVELGRSASVVVTAFAFDGERLDRADYSFTLRRSVTPGRTDGQLPRGGRTLFPGHLLVAFYGGTATPALGVLGEGTPTQAGQRLLEQIAPYESLTTREVMPVFELIATIATVSPGPEGHYSAPTPSDQIEPYLDAVRAIDGLLVLDIQPGRASFLDEARRYEHFLVAPDVGLAIDPEWKVGPTGRPGGGFIGSVDAAEINAVSAYLADLVAAHDLPEKLLVVHRFTPGMVTNDHLVEDRDGVAIVFHADGFGSPAAKLGDYFSILPDRFARGMKIFYRQDTRIMSPAELMALDPPPGFVSYQ